MKQTWWIQIKLLTKKIRTNNCSSRCHSTLFIHLTRAFKSESKKDIHRNYKQMMHTMLKKTQYKMIYTTTKNPQISFSFVLYLGQCVTDKDYFNIWCQPHYLNDGCLTVVGLIKKCDSWNQWTRLGHASLCIETAEPQNIQFDNMEHLIKCKNNINAHY